MRQYAHTRFFLALILTLAVWTLTCAPALAAVVHATYTFTDFTTRALSVKRVTVTPLASSADYAGAQLSNKPLIYSAPTYYMLTNGSITISNLVCGYAYKVAFSDGYSEPVITNYFGTNIATGAVVDANDYKTTYINFVNGSIIQVWYAYLSNTNSSGTSGALTNNDTRAVTFDTSLTIGAGSAANSIHPSAGLLTFSNSILANGSYIKGHSIIGTNFVGNGASLTNIHGSNSIAAGTISTNRMDATAYVAFNNDVTQAGLAAGSYISSETNGARLGDKIKLLTGNYKPVDLIIDADFSSDVGEEHGLKHAFALADQGFLNITAIGNCFTNPVSAAYIAKYANYYGYSHVPIGVTRTQRYVPYLNWTNNASQGFVSPYHLATNWIFPSHSLWNTNYPDVVSVYRKALVESANSNVVINIEGDLSNLRQLWESPADSYSSLNGSNLCELKVKYILISAGMTNNLNDYEYNIAVDQFAGGVINNLTVPVVWAWGNVVTNPGLGNLHIGQNCLNPDVHPVDSPLYQGLTNYDAHFAGGAVYREPWDSITKTYIASARNIADGSNWINGENYFSIVGPGRVDYQGGGFTAWSNTIAGKNANQYYIVTTQTLRDASTNFFNSFIDAPPKNGRYDDLRLTGGNVRGNVSIRANSTNAFSINTNLFRVNTASNQVSVGYSKAASISPGDNTTNLFEIVGPVATATTGTEALFQLSRPAKSGVSFAQAARFSIGRWTNTAAAEAQCWLTIDLKGGGASGDTYLGTSASWGRMMGFHSGANVWNESFYPHRFPLGSTANVSVGTTNAPSNGINFEGTTSVDLVASGSIALRAFGNDIYQSATGILIWGSGNIPSGVDTGIGRNAAGVVEANSGVQGTLRDFASRTVVTTNITFHTSAQAAYVLPVANGVTMFSSNAFLYSIHNLAGVYTTNLIKAP